MHVGAAHDGSREPEFLLLSLRATGRLLVAGVSLNAAFVEHRHEPVLRPEDLLPEAESDRYRDWCTAQRTRRDVHGNPYLLVAPSG